MPLGCWPAQVYRATIHQHSIALLHYMVLYHIASYQPHHMPSHNIALMFSKRSNQIGSAACLSFALQARAVIDGLPADMVALALPLDVQKIADAGLLSQNWRKSYPLGSVGE